VSGPAARDFESGAADRRARPPRGGGAEERDGRLLRDGRAHLRRALLARARNRPRRPATCECRMRWLPPRRARDPDRLRRAGRARARHARRWADGRPRGPGRGALRRPRGPPPAGVDGPRGVGGGGDLPHQRREALQVRTARQAPPAQEALRGRGQGLHAMAPGGDRGGRAARRRRARRDRRGRARGAGLRVTRDRGQPGPGLSGVTVVPTVHPSSVLRARESRARGGATDHIVRGLQAVAAMVAA
jgi:hypothetical protein